MLETIVLSLLLHLPGQKEPVEVIPGKIEVTYRSWVTSLQRREFEESVGLQEPIGGKPCVMCTYKVPEGHEQFWITVLKDLANSRIVWRVEQSRRSKGPANVHGERTWRIPMEKSTKKPLTVSFGEMLDAKINQYFRDRYEEIATVNVIKRGKNVLELSIDKMKGQVIAEQHFWERLDIYLVFFQIGNEARLYVDYDGYFATGIGSKPPPSESYSNMSNRYDWELSRYADMTTTALVSYLEKSE